MGLVPRVFLAFAVMVLLPSVCRLMVPAKLPLPLPLLPTSMRLAAIAPLRKRCTWLPAWALPMTLNAGTRTVLLAMEALMVGVLGAGRFTLMVLERVYSREL